MCVTHNFHNNFTRLISLYNALSVFRGSEQVKIRVFRFRNSAWWKSKAHWSLHDAESNSCECYTISSEFNPLDFYLLPFPLPALVFVLTLNHLWRHETCFFDRPPHIGRAASESNTQRDDTWLFYAVFDFKLHNSRSLCRAAVQCGLLSDTVIKVS